MKRVLNGVISLSAIIGIVFILGSVGKADYMSEIGQEYSIVTTMLTMLKGFILCVPAMIRRAM